MAKNNKNSLGERIKELRLSLQKPYYFFSIMENGEIMINFEDEKGEKVSFREKTMIGCVQKTEDYLVASRIRTGQEAKLKTNAESSTTTASPSKSTDTTNGELPKKEDDGIDITTKVKDGDGKEHNVEG